MKFDNSVANGSEPIQDIITVVNAVQSRHTVSQSDSHQHRDRSGRISKVTAPGILTSDGCQQANAAILSKTDVIPDVLGRLRVLLFDLAVRRGQTASRSAAHLVDQRGSVDDPGILGNDIERHVTDVYSSWARRQSHLRNSAGVSTIDGTVYAYVRNARCQQLRNLAIQLGDWATLTLAFGVEDRGSRPDHGYRSAQLGNWIH